jgi:serine/threonine protein kinase
MIGRYRIRKALGYGTVGAVYLAEDTQLDRRVAIKVLRAGRQENREIRQRFLQEARYAAAIEDPHIAAIHDIAQDGELDFIVMEYISGRTLDRTLSKKGLGVQRCLRYGRQLASALAKIHSAGMIHRDLKPVNVMIAANNVKLLDFGLAKYIRPECSSSPRSTRQSPQTRDGTILGTVGYMSPEQVRGEIADARSDIFSFGAVFYEMVVGRRLFKGRSDIDTMSAILHQPVPPLPRNVPASLGTILLRCLEKRPNRRYKTATQLLSALNRAARDFASRQVH